MPNKPVQVFRSNKGKGISVAIWKRPNSSTGFSNYSMSTQIAWFNREKNQWINKTALFPEEAVELIRCLDDAVAWIYEQSDIKPPTPAAKEYGIQPPMQESLQLAEDSEVGEIDMVFSDEDIPF